MNRNHFKRAGMTVLAASFATSTWAAVLIEGPPPVPAPTYVVPPERADGKVPIDIGFLLGVRPGESVFVTQHGMPAQRATAYLKGFGKDVRLIEALSQIVPPGWQIFMDGEGNLQQPVSWDGDRNWVATLNSVLNQATPSARAHIDWQLGELHLKWEAAPVTVALAPTQTAATAPVSETSVSEALGKTESPAGEPVPSTLFRLETDKTLSENLKSWAQKEGWDLVWHAPVDYVVSSPRLYEGELTNDGGAIIQVMNDYLAAPRPIGVWIDRQTRRIEVR